MSPPRVLVLAGLDPSGRAGLLADGEAIRAAGAAPLLCATALTAQSQQRLLAMQPVTPALLKAQVDAILEDGPVSAVKIGMLGSKPVLVAILKLLDTRLKGLPVVVDPVLSTSSGGELFDGVVDDLLPLFERARLVTPNLAEARAIGGVEVNDEILLHEAASRVALRGAKAVLVKGGHLQGEPTDLLLDGQAVRWFRGERIAAKKRGTGCRLASSIAAHLALGLDLSKSVEAGRSFVRFYLSAT